VGKKNPPTPPHPTKPRGKRRHLGGWGKLLLSPPPHGMPPPPQYVPPPVTDNPPTPWVPPTNWELGPIGCIFFTTPPPGLGGALPGDFFFVFVWALPPFPFLLGPPPKTKLGLICGVFPKTKTHTTSNPSSGSFRLWFLDQATKTPQQDLVWGFFFFPKNFYPPTNQPMGGCTGPPVPPPTLGSGLHRRAKQKPRKKQQNPGN